MWQWWNFCAAQIPGGKSVLKINVDETSICLFQGNVKGNILFSKKRPRDEEPVQRMPRSRRRCCLTHVAFVCDQPELQPVLPQVIVGNEVALPARSMAALRAACPANVRLVRQKSAWNNMNLMAIIIRILALALRPYTDRFQPVLLLDAVRLHFAQVVLNACNNCGIWAIFVPAKTTWLLQPLDTHAFQAFKIWLRNAYQRARAEAARHDLSVQEFLPCLYEAIRSVLQGRDWKAAFNENGFGNGQSEVSSHVRRELGMDLPLAVPASRPSPEQLECIFPRRTVVPAKALWRPFDAPAAPKASSAMLARAKPAALALPGPVVFNGRTRADHRLAVEHAKAASSVAEAKAVGPIVARGHRLARARVVVEGQ